MTKDEEQTIRNLIERLEAPRLGSGEGYVEGVDSNKARIYIDTWIVAPLKLLLPGEGRDPKLARSMSGK